MVKGGRSKKVHLCFSEACLAPVRSCGEQNTWPDAGKLLSGVQKGNKQTLTHQAKQKYQIHINTCRVGRCRFYTAILQPYYSVSCNTSFNPFL